VGSKPSCGNHFSCTVHLDQKHGSKTCGKFTWQFCMNCNLENGRLEYQDHSIVKSMIKTDELKAPQLTRTPFPAPCHTHKKKVQLCIWSILEQVTSYFLVLFDVLLMRFFLGLFIHSK